MPTEYEFYTALEKRHGTELQRKIRKSCVAVCGLGGLGSNIAVLLARMGIGKLLLLRKQTALTILLCLNGKSFLFNF